jgi:hypothetical protein
MFILKLYIIQIKLEAVDGSNREIEVPFTKHKGMEFL